MTKALIVGFGSIGSRHARILKELGCSISVVSQHAVGADDRYSNLSTAVENCCPDYIVIANETSAHLESIRLLVQIGYRGRLLIEKPLAVHQIEIPEHQFKLAAVAYNLRFHPVVTELKQKLADEEIISAHVYCGQYLPDWRPDIDYRLSYSAKHELGGGVLRDLSHEIDYMSWLLGGWRRLAALGGIFSLLEITSDDIWGVLAEYEHCHVATLQINYLDRPGRREIIVNTQKHTFKADLKSATLECDGQVSYFQCNKDDTYRAQHAAMLTGENSRLCSLESGTKVMKFLDACEVSAHTGKWVRA
jgi:predicted dehydrogenase